MSAPLSDIEDLMARVHAFRDATPGAIREVTPAAADAELLARLRQLDPALARRLEQALKDLGDSARLSYLGPASEIREVMRAVIHRLAPDAEVKQETWFKGDEHGRPTQAERVRYIARKSGDWETARDAADTVDEKTGRLARTLYSRASKAMHAGAERREVEAIRGYASALLSELIPPS